MTAMFQVAFSNAFVWKKNFRIVILRIQFNMASGYILEPNSDNRLPHAMMTLRHIVSSTQDELTHHKKKNIEWHRQSGIYQLRSQKKISQLNFLLELISLNQLLNGLN